MTMDERMDAVDEALDAVNATRTPDELAEIERRAIDLMMDDIEKERDHADY